MSTTDATQTPSRRRGRTWLQGSVLAYAPHVLLDGLLVLLAYAAALWLRFGGRVPSFYVDSFVLAAPFIAGAYCLSALAFRLYRRAWRYASITDLMHLSAAVGLATLVLLVLDVVVYPQDHVLPLSAVLLGAVFAQLALSLDRFAIQIRRFLESGLFPRGQIGVVIVGAGQVGQFLAREMLRNQQWDYQPVCFVDDDPKKQGLRIHGVPVRGTLEDIPANVAGYNAEVVAVAAPSMPSERLRRIVEICQPLPARLLYVPGIPEVLDGRGSAMPLREFRIEDLLGRQTVAVDLAACMTYIAGRVVLVSGAAGSIGSELCRQVLRLGPSRLVLLDNNESGIYDLAGELRADVATVEVHPCVGSVTDRAKVRRVFSHFRPNVVFHAAAYKHVPLMEEFPEEAVRVNVFGTRTVSEAADEFGVERFVLLSTDKAVRPSNVMGATKRLAELMIMELGQRSETVFCAVRFGNVLGSRGSVVPLFTKQIERGGPITITHPDVRRFFMTIPEAVSLVIEAGSFATSGDIFVLEMGEQVKIQDLAEKMARFRGLRLGKDIEVVYTGLRPGEKLAEELVGDAEAVMDTDHPKIRRLSGSAPAAAASWTCELLGELVELGDAEQLREVLLGAVAEDGNRSVRLGATASVSAGEPSSGGPPRPVRRNNGQRGSTAGA